MVTIPFIKCFDNCIGLITILNVEFILSPMIPDNNNNITNNNSNNNFNDIIITAMII